MSISYVKCPKCGNAEFKMFRDPKPDDIVTCLKCGFTMPHSTYRAMLDSKVSQGIKDEVSKFRKRLKKM